MSAGGHHHVEANDTWGKFIGFQTAILAVLLTVFTIMAHRAHTDTVLAGNKANNGWSYYQAKRIRSSQVEMNSGLIKLLAPDSPQAKATLEDYAKLSEKYKHDLEEIKENTEAQEKAEETSHHRASIFDLAEGLFEMAMILSSLYFITKKKFFPIMGFVMGLAGLVVGLWGFLLH